jgi:hypothetical protein
MVELVFPICSNMLGPVWQILRLFSDSAGSINGLKEDLADARKLLGARHKQLHQQWCRSVTLRHVITLLDQIDKVAQVFQMCLGLHAWFTKNPYVLWWSIKNWNPSTKLQN